MAEDEFNQALMVVMENCHQFMQDNGRVVGASDEKGKATQTAPAEKATVGSEAAESVAAPSAAKQEDWFTRFIMSGERPDKAGDKRLNRRGKY